ncbi:Protein of unknown function [Pyronema omphalodes CBS 100304]|uniref:Uncharacterized protein n=1 Tax=Pyronema omphalodes (strain CBS 100304) TaxID=1076935 RepID=U4L135_PYROM|nr:Protein of unknown function [Pyronema omphalodes CBS 100304]
MLFKDKDFKNGFLTDRYYHKYRNSGCIIIADKFKSQTVSYKVHNGCCESYDNDRCEGKLFVAKSREHNKLGSSHAKKIQSFKCNHNAGS